MIENTCSLPSRIAALSVHDQGLVDRFVEVLEAHAVQESPMDRIRRRIEEAKKENGERR